MVNDATVEKLGEILRDNPRGVLVFRDELAGFLRSMEREGREADRAFYLEAWQGDGRFSYDRIGRGTSISRPAASRSWALSRPARWPLTWPPPRAVASATTGWCSGSIQVTVWPDIARSWRNCDRWPSADAKALYQQAFYDLDNLRPDRMGASVEDDCLPYFRFDPLAQEVFDVWRHQIEAHLRAGDLLPTFEAHLAKYRSLVPSLALIFHLLDGGSGPVGQAALSLAMRWAEFLEAHARRLYSTVIAGDVHAARALAKRIRARDVQSPFTPRAGAPPRLGAARKPRGRRGSHPGARRAPVDHHHQRAEPPRRPTLDGLPHRPARPRAGR
jgi:putative DNA primase/helicase